MSGSELSENSAALSKSIAPKGSMAFLRRLNKHLTSECNHSIDFLYKPRLSHPFQLTADLLVLCCTLNESVRQCYCCEMKKNDTMCTQQRERSRKLKRKHFKIFYSNFLPDDDVIFHQLNSISFHFPIDMTHNNKARAFAQFSEKRKFSF